MTTLTGRFLHEIVKKSNKPIVDDNILLEAKMIITDEMSSNIQNLKDNIQEKLGKKANLVGETTVISGITRRHLIFKKNKKGAIWVSLKDTGIKRNTHSLIHKFLRIINKVEL